MTGNQSFENVRAMPINH